MLIDAIRDDAVYALRGLRRSPGLTAVILLTFALALGVNAALFTVLDRVFFQSPPGVVDPSAVRRLVGFSGLRPDYNDDQFTTKDFTSFRGAAANAAAIEGYDVLVGRSIGDDPKKRAVGYATTGFFGLVGVRPLRGRFFTEDENRFGSPTNVLVVSHAYWQGTLAGDSAILGRTLRVDAKRFTVIGVLPPRFEGMDVDAVDAWAPLAALPSGSEGQWWNGDFNVLRLFARVAPTTDARSLEARLNQTYRGARAFTLERDSTIRLDLAPLLQARSALGLGRTNARNLALMWRLGGVGLMVLVVGASNVASLLLLRALRRRREIAIRLALGISRRRLMAQLFIESVVLALAGGLVALLIAAWTGGILRTVLLANIHWTATVVDRRVVALTLLAALVAGVAAGFAPASVVRRRNIMAALKAGAAESGRSRSFGRVALLVAQTALCVLMIATTGLFVQSLRRASTLDLGFAPEHLIETQLVRVDPNAALPALDRIRALPGVSSVSRSGMNVRGGTFAGVRFSNGERVPLIFSPTGGFVDTAFATAVGLRVIAGRFIDASDAPGSEPVVVLNQAMAREYWPQRSPIGDCIHVGVPMEPCRRIVGVVSSAHWYLDAPPPKQFYMASAHSTYPRTSVSIRTRERASGATVAEIREILATIPGQQRALVPILVSEWIAPQVRPWRIAAIAFSLGGLLALVAAAAGIYGLVGYEVAQRVHEFGVRIAIGAQPMDILRLVLTSGVRVVGIGIGVGIVAMLAAGRVIASLLFATSPYEPTVLLATAVTLTAVALLASLVPGWRATRVDPVVALRAE